MINVNFTTLQAYVALSLGDFILAGNYAATLLELQNLPGGYSMLGHLYCAESLIIQVCYCILCRDAP